MSLKSFIGISVKVTFAGELESTQISATLRHLMVEKLEARRLSLKIPKSHVLLDTLIGKSVTQVMKQTLIYLQLS